MFLTTRQKAILEAQRLHLFRGGAIAHERLGVSQSSVDSVNTDVFKNFVEALELMADPEHFGIFEGRFKKHHDKVWELTRKIRSQLRP